MIIHKLTIQNIGPFRREVTINFSDLANIVSLTGPNGIGKTFLLECVPGALYNYWPFRMQDRTSVYDLIGKNEPAKLEMIFSINGRSFRIIHNYIIRGEWKQDAFKMSSQNHTAFIYERTGDGPDDGWEPQAQGVAEVKNYIEKYICTEQLFMASVFNSQNSAGDLVSVKASERKEIFAQLIGLEGHQKRADFYGLRTSQIEKLIEQKRASRAVHQASIVDYASLQSHIANNQQRIENIKLQLADLNMKRDSTIAERAKYEHLKEAFGKKEQELLKIDSKLIELEATRKRLSEKLDLESALLLRKEQLADLKKKLGELEKQLSGREQIYKDIQVATTIKREIENARQQKKDALTDERNKLSDALRISESLLDLAKGNLEQYNALARQAEKLEGLDCPKNCIYVSDAVEAKQRIKNSDPADLQSNIDKLTMRVDNDKKDIAAFPAHITSELSEYVLPLREQDEKIAAGNAELDAFTAIDRDHKNTRREIESIEQGNIEGRLAEIEQARERIPEIAAEIEAAQKQQAELKAELEAIQIPTNPYAEIINSIDRDIQNRTNDIKLGEQEITRAEEQIRRSNEAQIQIESIDSALEDYETLRSYYSRLCTAYGPNGIQALIIDSEKAQFLQIGKKLFSILSGGRIELVFETLKKNKAGDVKEDFVISLIVDGVKRLIEQCSGGEQALAKIVMRATLGIYHSQKSGGRLATYFLDETTGALDVDNRAAYLNFLSYLTQHFAQVVVVTHQDLNAVIPCRLTITENREIMVEN